MASVIRGSDNFDTVLATSIAIIADVKAININGGSAIAGWQTRDLNTELSDDEGIVSIANNEFTLQAGKYLVKWGCPAYMTNRTTSRLYNVTNASVEQEGSIVYINSPQNDFGTARGVAIVNISVSTVFKIEHHTQTAKATEGLGVSNTIQNSVYTTVEIHKVGV